MDVGCSNGSFLKYISEKIPLKKYIDRYNQPYLNLQKKRINQQKFITMILQGIQKKNQSDIVHSAGVLNIFDNVKILFLN